MQGPMRRLPGAGRRLAVRGEARGDLRRDVFDPSKQPLGMGKFARDIQDGGVRGGRSRRPA